MWSSIAATRFVEHALLTLLHGDGQFLRGHGKMLSRAFCVFGKWPQKAGQPGSLLAASIKEVIEHG